MVCSLSEHFSLFDWFYISCSGSAVPVNGFLHSQEYCAQRSTEFYHQVQQVISSFLNK